MILPRIKICGITRVDDGLAAARAGADAIGLVFYEKSPRAVSLEQAASIVAALPPFVTTVGLFVDADAAQIARTLQAVPLDMLQFHGNESGEFCRASPRPWMKAVRMKDGVDLDACVDDYQGASGLLLDSYVPGLPGGTGATFNWQRVPRHLPLPLVLAGGLNPDNVAAAVAQVQPWAVDVSGGVELIGADGGRQPGLKDEGAIQAFIYAARGRA